MSQTVDIFIALLRSAITGTNEEIDLSDLNWESLYSLAKFHDLAHIIYYELNKRGMLGEGEIVQKLKNQFDMAVYRHIKREHTIIEIRKILEEARIPFILLKGSYLMIKYPESWMRTSSDIDVLVKKTDFTAAEKCFILAGMHPTGKGSHDEAFQTIDQTHVELHFSLIADYRSTGTVRILNNVWEHSCSVNNNCYEHIMDDDYFYFYHMAHIANHLQDGGCGIRYYADIWLLNHNTRFDKDKRKKLLSRGGLLAFADRAERLSECWFSGQQLDSTLSLLAELTINGGIYGTMAQGVAIRRGKNKNRLSYYLKRVFLPYSRIKHSYPILITFPFLLPVCWIVRLFKLLDPAVRAKVKSEQTIEKNMDSSESIRIESLMKDLEIW